MLLPHMSVVDVITTEADVIACYILFYYWLMLLPICGRCYSHFGVMWWQMLLPSGRWNSHCRVDGGLVVDVITTRQMVLPWVNGLF